MAEPSDLTYPTGATRLYPILGDPIKYVESPTRLTRTLHARDHDGITSRCTCQAPTSGR